MVKKIVIVGIVLLMLVGIFGCSSKDKEESRKEPIVVEKETFSCRWREPPRNCTRRRCRRD